jgi:hypothetical protein
VEYAAAAPSAPVFCLSPLSMFLWHVLAAQAAAVPLAWPLEIGSPTSPNKGAAWVVADMCLSGSS